MNVYIHVPWCAGKCIYCDFYSVVSRQIPWDDYSRALTAEFKARCSRTAGDDYTLYIGGGTPSLMPEAPFFEITEVVTGILGRPVEFTVEVNPDDVTPEKADMWRRAGVNRVSMGVQSLVDAELRNIGRRHDSARARRAYDILRNVFSNVSLDLMFGLPGQTLNSLRDSIEGFIEMRPEHISAYSLMYEERTRITRMLKCGEISETDEDVSVEMFRMINGLLADAGYDQYEISNYSLPGFRSRHNSAYWEGKEYVGLGPGAHSYDGKSMRSSNAADVKEYIRCWLAGRPAHKEEEWLGADELREEMILTRLRTSEGLSLDDFETRFGPKAKEELMMKAQPFLTEGILALKGCELALTKDGIMVSDEIIVELF